MPASLIVGGTGVSGSFIVSGLIERGHDVTVYTTGRTVPTEEESPWWYDGSITRLEGGVVAGTDASGWGTGQLVWLDGARAHDPRL